MLYNQPYGISDPNAAYINGNPTTGTQGSIPPAASIEYDQREIVAVIQYAAAHGFYDFAGALCANPTNADLQQLLKAIFGILNSTRLVAPKTYYVNAATGDDTFDGSSTSKAFKTLQRAANQATLYNLNGYNVTVNVADGTYAPVILPNVNGSGWIYFTGNNANPIACKIHANTGPAVHVGGGPYAFQGFRYESDASDIPGGRPGAGVWSPPGGSISVGAAGPSVNEFGFCADGHMVVYAGSLSYVGTIRVLGNSQAHIAAAGGASTYGTGNPMPTLVIPNAITVGTWVISQQNASVSPRYVSMSGKANVTGQTYFANMNGVIDSGGGGTSFLPGTIAGSSNTGGQYV